MPKGTRSKFYAVLNGRGGPRIYTCWEEYRIATHSFSGACSKSFITHEDAVAWLEKAGVSQIWRQGVAMIPTPPPTPGSLSSRPSYPNSALYWTEYKQNKADVGVQTTHLPDFEILRTPTVCTNPARQPKVAASQIAPPSLQKSQGIELSVQQKRVLELVISGKNIFFTGPAGTGKSVLLREIIHQLKQIGQVAVTATTGIAGLNIGGSTVHSFAGIGLGKEPAERLTEKILRSQRLRERWRSTKVLIIDEISMMDALLFDKLEHIARVVRECPRPFGGIQLILSGDFFQLPPVPDQSYEYRMASTYAFDAKSWSRCVVEPVFLNQVFRQRDDVFVDILSSMRGGVLTAQHIKKLQQLSRPLHYTDGIEPSELFPLRSEVEGCNNSRLAALPGPEYTYHSTDSAGYDNRCRPIPEESAKALLERLVAVPSLTLKIGAQNIEQGFLVNGSTGKVIEFLTTSEAVARHIQIATFSGLKSGPPECSPAPHSPSNFELRPLNGNAFSRKEKWPLVHFTNGCQFLCAPLQFTVQGFMGNVEALRLQVPLILAWALSIHKSQGQTLTRVKVDLGRVFEKGQAYVALSRATTMEHLELVNFEPSKVMAHPRVLHWQEFWASIGDSSCCEMDSEEAISRFWEDSETLAVN